MSAAAVSPWLRLWGAYVRWSARQQIGAPIVRPHECNRGRAIDDRGNSGQ